ncbi:hypothetical protein JOE48_002856 [Methylobacterium sp. PvR107]|nr:hypothetical protein [Methylobacterium sp. PvR107]
MRRETGIRTTAAGGPPHPRGTGAPRRGFDRR